MVTESTKQLSNQEKWAIRENLKTIKGIRLILSNKNPQVSRASVNLMKAAANFDEVVKPYNLKYE